MKIPLPEKKDYKPAPEGLHQGVCVDFVNMGKKMVTYKGEKPKEVRRCRYVFELEATFEDEEGKEARYIHSEFFNIPQWLSPNSGLRIFVTGWIGPKRFAELAAKGFDTDWLVGEQIQLSIQHAPKPDGEGVWANATPIPAADGQSVVPSGDYTPVKERDGYSEPDDDIPF